jgi:hypothetical protein
MLGKNKNGEIIMNEDKRNIRLAYYKNAILEKDLDIIENKFSNVGIALDKQDLSGIIMNSIDLFSPQIYFSFILGAISTGVTYDIFKWGVIKIWKELKGKHLNKIEAGGKIKQKECTFGLSIDIAEKIRTQCILPNFVPDNEKEECVDKLFEFLENYNTKGFNYLKYETSERKWLTIDFNKKIQKIREQK